jgi:tetratricopeptide (TPR) repeat protein
LPYVTAAGALLVAAFIAITIIAGLTKAHHDKIAADAKRLEENYALAHQAMQEMMRLALTNPRLHAAVHNPLRREMLERVIGYYRRALDHRKAAATKPESAEERAKSLPIRRELALATLFLGLTEFNLAMTSEVPPAVRDGVEQYKALAAENPDDLDLVYGSIASRHLLGRAWYQLQKHDEAIRVLCEVHEELAHLDRAAVPDVGEMTIIKTVGKPEVLQIELIVILADMANSTPQAKEKEQILRWVDAARTQLEERDRAAGGKDVAIRTDLAKLQFQSAVRAMLASDLPTAESGLKAAWVSLTEPPRESGVEDFLLQLDVRLRLGMLYVQTKRPEQAIADLEPAYRELTPILDNFETQVAGNAVPPRMAFEALAKLILVSAQLNAAEAMLGGVREPGSIAQGLEAMTRKKVRRQRLQVFSRALPLLVSQFPEAAIGLPLLASMANNTAEELSELEMHAEARSLLKAADTILAGNLARTPDVPDLQAARVGLLTTLALTEEKLGHAAEQREANTTARRMLIAFLTKPQPIFEQPTHSVALLLGDDAMKTKQWREALDLFKVTCAAADRTIAQPSNPAFARQARNVLEITVYHCSALLTADPPLSAAELAESKRQGIEALDLLAKHGVAIDNAATYRERFSKG